MVKPILVVTPKRQWGKIFESHPHIQFQLVSTLSEFFSPSVLHSSFSGCLWDEKAFGLEAFGKKMGPMPFEWLLLVSDQRIEFDPKMLIIPHFSGCIEQGVFFEFSAPEQDPLSKSAFLEVLSLLSQSWKTLSHGLDLSEGFDCVCTRQLTHTKDRTAFIENILQGQHGFSSRMLNRVHTCLDELILNAIFDAPGDPGQQRLAQRKRSDLFELSDKNKVEVKVWVPTSAHALAAGDQVGAQLVFQVTDFHGNLILEDTLKRALSDYENKPATQLSDSQENAGLGLMSVFSQAGLVHFFVRPGQLTCVTIWFCAAGGLRTQKKSPLVVCFSQG
jgi:hypothetical protein